MSDETVPATTDHPVTSTTTKRKRAPRKKAVEQVETAVDVSVEEVVAEPAENVITAPEKKPSKTTSAMQNDNGVFISPGAERAKEPVAVVEPKKEPEKVALWSSKNMRWGGTGYLEKGYNLVIKEVADKWLTRNGVREASPEEVAAHYGK